MRASIVVLGPLAARFGEAEVSAPGGCNLGLRKFNFHLDGLRALGAQIELDHGFIKASAPGGLRGAEINFEYPSVTATENVMMAAVLAEGITIIENGAREPEVVDLAGFLNAMGARVKGAGTGRIVIEGVEELRPVEWTVIPDRIEAGTFMMATVAAGGDVTIRNSPPEHLKMELENGAREPEVVDLAGFLNAMGARVKGAGTGRIVIEGVEELRPVEWTVIPDRIEAGTFMMATVAAGGDVTIRNSRPEHLKMELEKLKEMGVSVSDGPLGGIRVRVEDPADFTGVDVSTLPFQIGRAHV